MASTSRLPSYDLCPAGDGRRDHPVRCDAAARELARLGRPLVISGHSAGGHLAACLLATDWPALDASLPKDLVIAAYAISGPVRSHAAGRDLHQQGAAASTTRRRRRPARCSGGRRRTAVSMPWSARRKARNISARAGRWSKPGRGADLPTRYGVVAGANHFTAIAPLADPASAHGVAVEAIGAAVTACQKRWMARIPPLRPIILSLKCLSRLPKRCRRLSSPRGGR